MYIKINKRLNKKWGYNNLQFSVIESFRDAGKVKHRSLAHIGTIPESRLNHPYWLGIFWEKSERKLEVFAEADRLKLAARLETIAPRPTKEMREEHSRWVAESLAEDRRLRG
jgi:hypothetical protein